MLIGFAYAWRGRWIHGERETKREGERLNSLLCGVESVMFQSLNSKEGVVFSICFLPAPLVKQDKSRFLKEEGRAVSIPIFLHFLQFKIHSSVPISLSLPHSLSHSSNTWAMDHYVPKDQVTTLLDHGLFTSAQLLVSSLSPEPISKISLGFFLCATICLHLINLHFQLRSCDFNFMLT